MELSLILFIVHREGNYPEISVPLSASSHSAAKAISSDTGPVPGYLGDAEWEVGAGGRRLSFVVACVRMRPPDSHGQVGQSFNQTPYLPLQSSAARPHL